MFIFTKRCLLYFTNKRKAIQSEAKLIVLYGKNTEDYRTSVIISCRIPRKIKNLVPRAVSLISMNDCPKKAHNSLRVIYEKPNKTKESFAVCHKALRFSVNDLSLRLIEWLELLRILGVSKVFLYSYGVHPNIQRVLNYYKKTVSNSIKIILIFKNYFQGFVDLKESTLPGEQPNNKYLYQRYAKELDIKFWTRELLEYSDCFLRNIHKYEYIAVFDIDEVIVPTNADNWTQMIDIINV